MVALGEFLVAERRVEQCEDGVDRTVGAGALPTPKSRIPGEASCVEASGLIIASQGGRPPSDHVRRQPGEVLDEFVERGAGVQSCPVGVLRGHSEGESRMPRGHSRLLGHEGFDGGDELIQPVLRHADHQDLGAVGGHRPRR